MRGVRYRPRAVGDAVKGRTLLPHTAHRHHPADVLLKPYVERISPTDARFPEAVEAVEIAREDLRAAVDSIPPPAALSVSRERVIARVGKNTGSWELEELERELRATIERAAAEKLAAMAARLAEEVDARKALQGTVKEIRDGQRKFWMTVLAGVLIGVIVAGFGWTTAQLISIHK